MDDEEQPAVEAAIGPAMTAEAALWQIVQRCAAEIDAHLAFVLERDDAAGPHKARVWLRRTVTALDAFAPILKRKATEELRDEAKAIFRLLGKLRDHDVLLAALPEEERSAKLEAETARLRDKVRKRLREDDAVLFSPVLARQVGEGALLRKGARALELRSGPVCRIATGALDETWTRCMKRGQDIESLRAPALHRFRKDLKALRYMSEFFAPFLPDGGAATFRSEMQRMQDLLGVATDAEVARAGGKSSWALVDRDAVRAAVAEATAVWQALVLHDPWWRRRTVVH